jgi:hypothetical protein
VQWGLSCAKVTDTNKWKHDPIYKNYNKYQVFPSIGVEPSENWFLYKQFDLKCKRERREKANVGLSVSSAALGHRRRAWTGQPLPLPDRS